MSSLPQVVQTASTGREERIDPDFTYEELLAELELMHLPVHGETPTRTPGGVDAYQVMVHKKTWSRMKSFTWLMALEKCGKLISRIEWDEAKRARVRVWRPKERP